MSALHDAGNCYAAIKTCKYAGKTTLNHPQTRMMQLEAIELRRRCCCCCHGTAVLMTDAAYPGQLLLFNRPTIPSSNIERSLIRTEGSIDSRKSAHVQRQ